MQRRTSRWVVGSVTGLLAVLALPSFATAAGPGRVADGQPDNDTQLSVLTPEQQAFMDRKLAMAAAVGVAANRATGTAGSKTTRDVAPMFACETDPCEGTPPPPPPPPPPSGPPTSKTLATRARQQINYYFCGPASGQVVINWSRGIINGNNDGEDSTTNWRRQSKIAEWMGTTTAGTGGASVANGLNNPNAVVKPAADWIYAYEDIGTTQDLYNKIVTDVASFGMPLILATAPHLSGAGVNFLESWPKVTAGAHHWIVLRGYDGAWGNPSTISIKYQDSSAGYGGSTGAFDDPLSVIWQVSKWNQGGHVVW